MIDFICHIEMFMLSMGMCLRLTKIRKKGEIFMHAVWWKEIVNHKLSDSKYIQTFKKLKNDRLNLRVIQRGGKKCLGLVAAA